MSEFYSSRPTSSAFFRVHTPKQAQILSDAETKRFFFPFLGREKTVAEAAAEVGCKLNAMHYRVKTFMDAGLLQVMREEKRAGRPIKVYRSVTDGFFVPFDLTSYADAEEDWLSYVEPTIRRIARVFDERRREQIQDARIGHCLFRDGNGSIGSIGGMEKAENAEIVLNVDTPKRTIGTDRSGDIRLTEEEAERLQAELISLFSRYLQRFYDDPETPRKEHLFIYAFAPLEPE